MQDNSRFIESWKRSQTGKIRAPRRKYIALVIVAAVVLAAVIIGLILFTDLIIRPDTSIAVTSGPNEWSMFGRDLTHSFSIGQNNANIQGKVSTVLTTSRSMLSSPVSANGIVYVGSEDYNLYAIDQATGQTLWSFKTGSFVDSTAVISEGVIYFGSNDGNLYALNAQTGDKIWAFRVERAIRSAPAVADGKIIFGCEDYFVYAVDAKTGEDVWKKETGSMVDSSPAVANGMVFVGSMDGNFYVLDARNGRQHLRFDAKEIIASAPAVVGDTVYFSTAEGYLYAIDGRARNWFGESKLRDPWQVLNLYGDLPAPPPPSGYLWSLNLQGICLSSPSIIGNTLYLGAGNRVFAVDLETKKVKWSYPTGGLVTYAAELSPNTVYAVGKYGHLYMLNATTGELISDIAVGGSINTAPLMVNGTIYISSEDGCLYSVK